MSSRRFQIKSGPPLIHSDMLRRRVVQLGREIAPVVEQGEVILLGLMNGALLFLADLLRELPPEARVQCCRVASYVGTESTGEVSGLERLGEEFTGREVIIVDDILDTGCTLAAVTAHLRGHGARRVEACVLLRKAKPRESDVDVRWVGFDIADEFVVGYGLDYEGQYRGLPDIRVGSIA